MTLHQMNLQEQYFDYIQTGTKRIELRLYDDKRRQIKLGDEIEFAKSDTVKLKAQVIGLLLYNSFEELFEDLPMELLADKTMTKSELLEVLGEFYTDEQQQKYGVVGIRLKILPK